MEEARWKQSIRSLLEASKSLNVFVEELVSDYISKAKDPKVMESRLVSILNDILDHTADEGLRIKLKAVLGVLREIS